MTADETAADIMCRCAEQARMRVLIAEMRATAILLERFNREYNLGIANGSWTPQRLRYEANYLEKRT